MVTLIRKRPKKATEDLKENDIHSNGTRSACKARGGESKTNFEKHVCPKQKLIMRSRETEKYRDKDVENKAKIEGAPLMYETKLLHRRKSSRTSLPESKVMLQDITRKRKDVNCVEKRDDEARELDLSGYTGLLQ